MRFPYKWPIREGRVDVVKWLISKEIYYGYREVWYSVEQNNLECVKLFSSCIQSYEKRFLETAAYNNNEEMLDYLLSIGVEINSRMSYNQNMSISLNQMKLLHSKGMELSSYHFIAAVKNNKIH